MLGCWRICAHQPTIHRYVASSPRAALSFRCARNFEQSPCLGLDGEPLPEIVVAGADGGPRRRELDAVILPPLRVAQPVLAERDDLLADRDQLLANHCLKAPTCSRRNLVASSNFITAALLPASTRAYSALISAICRRPPLFLLDRLPCLGDLPQDIFAATVAPAVLVDGLARILRIEAARGPPAFRHLCPPIRSGSQTATRSGCCTCRACCWPVVLQLQHHDQLRVNSPSPSGRPPADGLVAAVPPMGLTPFIDIIDYAHRCSVTALVTGKQAAADGDVSSLSMQRYTSTETPSPTWYFF